MFILLPGADITLNQRCYNYKMTEKITVNQVEGEEPNNDALDTYQRDLAMSVIQELKDDKESPFAPTADIDMVWVLSEPGTVDGISQDGPYAGASSDLINVNHGIEVVRQITALRVGKEVDDVTKEDIEASGPTFYYNGEDRLTVGQNYSQNQHLALLATTPEFPIPISKFVIDHLDIANTPAQIKCVARYLKDHDYHGKVATVSIGAHSARVGRYLEQYKDILPEGVQFLNAASTQTHNSASTTRREIRKIVKYAEKGDLSEKSIFTTRPDTVVATEEPQPDIETEQSPEELSAMNNLRELRKFLKIDKGIKEEIKSLSPPQPNSLEYGDSFVYAERLEEGVKSLDSQFDAIMESLQKLGFGTDEIAAKKESIIAKFRHDLAMTFEFSDVEKIYKNNIYGLSPEFLMIVSKEMTGYYMWKDVGVVLSKVHTFDELLNLIHMYLQSNESFYSKLPKWGEVRKDRSEYDAYGEETEYARTIFDDVSAAMLTGHIDALGNEVLPTQLMHVYSIDNLVQLMIRDYGHALLIEVDTSEPRAARIKYSFPKVINTEIVKNLPGIMNIQIEKNGASGSAVGKFELPYDNLGKGLADFIKSVPTDEMYQGPYATTVDVL